VVVLSYFVAAIAMTIYEDAVDLDSEQTFQSFMSLYARNCFVFLPSLFWGWLKRTAIRIVDFFEA
jgi:hypothetical protein